MSLPYQEKLIPRAKELRKNATKQENHLWYDFLRSYPVRFQRQKTIDHFIADFYCHAAKLIIELDGSQHYELVGQRKDFIRTQRLQKWGLNVLRIPNNAVTGQFREVCEYIDLEVQRLLSQASPPQEEQEKAPLPKGAGTPEATEGFTVEAL